MPLKKLDLVPDSAYSVTAPQAATYVRLGGGSGKIRLDQIGAACQFRVSWILDASQYQYFTSFWRVLNRGSEKFLIDLLFDSPALEEYEVLLVPGSLSLDSARGTAYVVSATLEGARTSLDDPEFDASIVDLYTEYGDYGQDLLAQLAQFANYDLAVPALVIP